MKRRPNIFGTSRKIGSAADKDVVDASEPVEREISMDSATFQSHEQPESPDTLRPGFAEPEHLWFDDIPLPEPESMDLAGGIESWPGAGEREGLTFGAAGDDLPDISADAATAASDAEIQPDALLGICEPLFRQVCRLNEIKRNGDRAGQLEQDRVRADLERTLRELSVAARKSAMSVPFEAISGALRCFVDVVMMRTGFDFADRWKRLSPKWANADRVITQAAAEALQGGPGAIQRLHVMHVCLCLTADLLRPSPGLPTVEHLLHLAGRRLGRSRQAVICPAAYEGVFTSAIFLPLGRRLRTLLILSLTMLLLVVTGAVALNLHYSHQLDRSIQTVRAALDRAAGAGQTP